MKPKPVKDSITMMSHLMLPSDANSAGLVHGGTILKLIDTISYICSSRHAKHRCVTASIDKVDFLSPIKIGELVSFYASVNHTGSTSMEIGVKVEAENLQTGKKRHTNSCYVTMVALNDRGKPAKIPNIITETPEQKIRNKEAHERRKQRLKTR